ncbi:MAG TPA: glycosyltransferase family 39 protein [Candidatus Thermoplasmatota archaeon]|nr:glycosyltransferase family 39 protein [Candidatus Thermoplasmatota archaeon]
MRRQVEPLLVAALLSFLVVWGVALRLEDPLSTRALGAEDPYTHVVFTKEWAEQGYFDDSFHLGTGMYPPGMHAFLIAFAPYTGIALYDIARVLPAILGGLAILGMYVVGARLANRAAGLAAAFATAIMPEHIFRTELLFPTAFDLALLPLWLLSFHLMLGEERRGGAILFVGASIPLAIMHPWAVPLFGVPLIGYAALRTLRAHQPLRASAQALLLPVALVVVATSFAMAFRWDDSDTGFADFAGKVPGLAGFSAWEMPGPLVFVIVLPMLAALAALGVLAVAALASVRLPRAARIGASLAVGAGLLALLVPLTRALPQDVDYHEMLGPIAVALALAGFALAFVRPTALGDMGMVVTAFLFPLTALDIFGSPYWPQRTVAYLAVGVALLAANVVGQLYETHALVARSDRARRVAGPAAIVALSLVATGAATAMPVDTYSWYRLYDEPAFAAFEEVARTLEEDPDAKVFIYTWQPALMVKTLADPDHVWYSPKFFNSSEVREKQLGNVEGTAYVLVDPYTREAAAKGKARLDFLDDDPRFRRVMGSGGVELYEVVR